MKRVSLVLILSVMCCFFTGCSNFSKHKVTNTEEVSTEIFLDKPDSLIRIKNGNEKQLSDDDSETVYNAFMNLMESFQNAETLKTQFRTELINEWKQKYTCFELRYTRRHNYVGNLYGEESLFSRAELKFDAFLFVYYSGGLIAVPYIDNNYVGINNLFLFLRFPDEEISRFISLI